MRDLDQPLQGAAAVDAGRLGPSPVIEDQRDATDFHGMFPRARSATSADIRQAGLDS